MKDPVKVSKLLSLVLRHKPEEIGITLDAGGWVDVRVLLAALARSGNVLSLEELQTIVEQNNKKRFAFSDDGLMIRANQGHTVDVALGYTECEPPAILYHGTAERFINSIKEQGLIKGQRHHVHMTEDIAIASQVGTRYGKLVLLTIDSGVMHTDGFLFYRSQNNVWLTEHVPTCYIRFPKDQG